MAALIFRAGMLAAATQHWWPVKRLAARPDLAQRQTLLRILDANARTRFGESHRFGEIDSPERYCDRVPVQDYETLRPYLDDQRQTGAPALTIEPPRFYAQTSGSTGMPKYIPVTASSLRIHRQEQALFTYLQYRACPAAFSGKAFGIMGAAAEGTLDSGQDVGSVSGYLYESLPSALRARFVVPPAVSNIADYDLKYFVMLRLALAEADITYLGSPNPSTFLRLIDVLQEQRGRLADSLERGTLDAIDQLEPATRTLIAPRLRPDAARAALLRGSGPLSFAKVWPGIRLLTTWTGGSCGIALDKLRRLLPPQAGVMELGYQSTECRGTLALGAETSGGLPPLHHHFFEFVEQHAWDAGRPAFLTLGRLEPGRRYYVIVTTIAGLYRYFMNDLVEVTGSFRATPLLRFVQKGRGVTSVTGEKLYESQVIQAVQDVARRFNVNTSFFLLVADEARSGYELFLEVDDSSAQTSSRPPGADIGAAIDARLGDLNVEYHAKRASGRLAPLTVAWVKRGTADAYKSACIRAGRRESQYKPAVLQYRRELLLSLDPYVIR
jgi:GH3 auxin-responsive promoter